MACEILVPRPGIEPMSPALEAQGLNHWTAREVPQPTLLMEYMPHTLPHSRDAMSQSHIVCHHTPASGQPSQAWYVISLLCTEKDTCPGAQNHLRLCPLHSLVIRAPTLTPDPGSCLSLLPVGPPTQTQPGSLGTCTRYTLLSTIVINTHAHTHAHGQNFSVAQVQTSSVLLTCLQRSMTRVAHTLSVLLSTMALSSC